MKQRLYVCRVCILMKMLLVESYRGSNLRPYQLLLLKAYTAHCTVLHTAPINGDWVISGISLTITYGSAMEIKML